MKTNYTANGSLQFSTLSRSEIEEIVSSSMEVLEGVGMMLMSDQVIEMLKKAGAWVDSQGRCHIPGYLVKKALATVPSRVVLAGRDGSRKLVMEKDRILFRHGSDTPFMYDAYTGERRAWGLRRRLQLGPHRRCPAQHRLLHVPRPGAGCPTQDLRPGAVPGHDHRHQQADGRHCRRRPGPG